MYFFMSKFSESTTKNPVISSNYFDVERPVTARSFH